MTLGHITIRNPTNNYCYLLFSINKLKINFREAYILLKQSPLSKL
jgi:hypothetical protein